MSNWTKIIDTPGNFAMSGVYLRGATDTSSRITSGKTLIAGYGDGSVWSWNPFTKELTRATEAVLGMGTINDVVYATWENNDSVTEKTYLAKRSVTGVWTSLETTGYAGFFSCVFNGAFIFTSCDKNLDTIQVKSTSDGITINDVGAPVPSWAWVPVVYNNELYLIGQKNLVSVGYKWTGSSFTEVPALLVAGVAEWQCGFEFNGYLFLGAGSWTTARDVNAAKVYRFNGTSCELVKHASGYAECQAILPHYGKLYATFGSGFKNDSIPTSEIWVSSDMGTSWTLSNTFATPQMYVLISESAGLIAAGGRLNRMEIYWLENEVVTAPPEIPRTEWTGNYVVPYGTNTGPIGEKLYKCTKCHAVFNSSGKIVGV